MSNRRKNRKVSRGSRKDLMGRAMAQTKLAANVTEEQDWYLDTPDVRLTRIFTVVLLLHVLAVGGILAFKMIDKASGEVGMQIASASVSPQKIEKKRSTLAAKVTQPQSQEEHSGVEPKSVSDRSDVILKEKALPAPLRRDPTKGKQYRVVAGDTLVEIANKLRIDPDVLRKKNSIRSDNELYPGRWLDLPDVKQALQISESAVSKPVSEVGTNKMAKPEGAFDSGEKSTYLVQSGDTLWAISRKFGITYQELITANKVLNPQKIQIGQKLIIPESK